MTVKLHCFNCFLNVYVLNVIMSSSLLLLSDTFYSHSVYNDVNVVLYWSESYNKCAPSSPIRLSVFAIILILIFQNNSFNCFLVYNSDPMTSVNYYFLMLHSLQMLQNFLSHYLFIP